MKPCENGNDCNCPEVCIVHPMTSPKMSYEEAKYEAAEKRSKHNCSSGYPDFDKEVRRLLRIGFEDGSDFGAKYERDQAAKLVEFCKIMQKAAADNKGGLKLFDDAIAEYEGKK